MRTIRLSDLLGGGERVHFAAPRISGEAPIALHDHDFCEVFWVEAGQGWHWRSGDRQRLVVGDMACIRPEDQHALTGGITLVNIAFFPDAWQAVRARYGPADLFASGGQTPLRHLTPAEQDGLRFAASDLRAGRRDALARDRFLLHLARFAESPTTPPPMPKWLSEAIEQLADPKHLREGTLGLADLAGRSPEHVARAVRRFLGKTPTDVLNDLRLAFAADRLGSTDDKIATIAEHCGLPNLAHFHAVFRGRFGTTPRRYRLRQQAIVRP